MLSAYPTRSIRHSRSSIGKWLLALPLIAATAGITVGSMNRPGTPSMTSFLPAIVGSSDIHRQRQYTSINRSASFRIDGPTAAGLAVMMNDNPALRAHAERARLKHASEQLADDTALTRHTALHSR